MIYLAQIQRRPVNRVELHLLALQDKRKLWITLTESNIVKIRPDLTDIADNSLVIVNISTASRVTEVTDGVSAIPLILQELSLQLLTLLAKQPKLEEWHDSLVYQSAELAKRAELLEAREEEIQVRETYLSVENSKLRKKLTALEKTKKALGETWEQVRFEQARLDNEA